MNLSTLAHPDLTYQLRTHILLFLFLILTILIYPLLDCSNYSREAPGPIRELHSTLSIERNFTICNK